MENGHKMVHILLDLVNGMESEFGTSKEWTDDAGVEEVHYADLDEFNIITGDTEKCYI